MNYRVITLYICGIFLLFNLSCNNGNEIGSIEISHFEKDVKSFSSFDNSQKDEFKLKYSDVIKILYNNSDTDLSNILQSKIYKTFDKDVSNIFNNTDSLQIEISVIKQQYNTYFKDRKFKRIITVITPFNQSIVSSDSSIIIGLNHYLGANHPMYLYFDEYLRRTKNPQQIQFDVAEVLARNIIGEPKSNSNLLSIMIYEGTILKIMELLLPDYSISRLLGYTKEQYDISSSHETDIWERMISQELLYSTSPIVINNIIKPGPSSSLISPECPGRIGRWIGYRIVDSYINNTKSTISIDYKSILSESPQTILIKSQYNAH